MHGDVNFFDDCYQLVMRSGNRVFGFSFHRCLPWPCVRASAANEGGHTSVPVGWRTKDTYYYFFVLQKEPAQRSYSYAFKRLSGTWKFCWSTLKTQHTTDTRTYDGNTKLFCRKMEGVQHFSPDNQTKTEQYHVRFEWCGRWNERRIVTIGTRIVSWPFQRPCYP